jgi:hypothetical protein
MNRQTTRTLQKILPILGVFVFLIFTFGGFLFPTIFKILGINSSLNVLGTFSSVFIGFIAVVIFIGLSVFVGYRQKAHRREDLKKFARQNSWTYQESTVLPFLKEFDAYINNSSWLSDSNCLTGSSNNVLMGVLNGRNILVSDQIYSTGSGKSRTTHEKTLLGIELREANLPFMCLYPEGFMDRVFDGFSKCDIDFPHRPHFSEKYVLYGANENQIRSFFNDRILAFYEQQQFFNTACGGKYLVIWQSGLLNPAQIMEQLNLLFYLANLFLKK